VLLFFSCHLQHQGETDVCWRLQQLLWGAVIFHPANPDGRCSPFTIAIVAIHFAVEVACQYFNLEIDMLVPGPCSLHVVHQHSVIYQFAGLWVPASIGRVTRHDCQQGTGLIWSDNKDLPLDLTR